MAQAAIPKYINLSGVNIPPGHHFRLYFNGWNNNLDKILETVKIDHRRKRSVKYPNLKRMISHSMSEETLMILKRYEFFADHLKPHIRLYHAITASSLVTGLGNEHPIENGFSFFDPWGVPYLPGSSVKGVLRMAAETLALFEEDTKGWTPGAVFWLFGFDGQSAYLRAAPRNETSLNRTSRLKWQERYRKRIEGDHLAETFIRRYLPVNPEDNRSDKQKLLDIQNDNKALKTIHYAGALQFWDAIFYPRNPRQPLMSVDIMTPHFKKYYQDHDSPSDNDTPDILYFLAIPPNVGVDFFTVFSPVRSFPDTLLRSWPDLLDSAFDYAATNLGFGAKTTAGYGRIKRLDQHS